MTTTVTVEAHCCDYEVVEVKTTQTGVETKTAILNDGETLTDHVYDDKQITVRERKREDVYPANEEADSG